MKKKCIVVLCSSDLFNLKKGYNKFYTPMRLLYEAQLKKYFRKVIFYDYLKRLIQIGISNMNKEIISIIKKESPEYILWFPRYYEIQETTLKSLKKYSKIIAWFSDDRWRFETYSKYWIPYIDFAVTEDIDSVEKYKNFGVPAIHAIPSTGPALDFYDGIKKYDVSFVGSRFYADRDLWIESILKNGIDVKTFGLGWESGFIEFSKMLDIFRTSKINLNFTKVCSDANKTQFKGRIFQVCLAGGFLLTEYVPGIETYFVIGKEIETFKTKEEMIEKIRYFLTHDKERESIAKAGWKRAVKYYSIERIIKNIIRNVDKSFRGSNINYNKSDLSDNLYMRKAFSKFYCHMAAMMAKRNNEKWKDAIWLSYIYNRKNLLALLCYSTSSSFLLIMPMELKKIARNIVEKIPWLRRFALKIIPKLEKAGIDIQNTLQS